MKIKVKDEKQKFQPIKLTITIETADDLESLWHRFNIDIDIIKERSNSIKANASIRINNTRDIWETLNDLAIDRGMRN